ncbi:MAG: phosphoribosylamine--glycine ligase [Thermoanaerobaculia bacterium]|nr:phosphoribosylamine--glycine ligase [Thermoanaerobaculia bacterium]
MRVLVVGNGGREHALCWKLRQSAELTELFCAPGNPGIARLADLVPIGADEIHALADFAQEARIDLTVIGPELPLTLGVVDEFRSRGLRIFGPSRAAAELEGSKAYAKSFLARHGIPTARFQFARHRAEAERAAAEFGLPVVLKADGLAAGKGVVVATDAAELEAGLAAMFDERRFGAAADVVVVEEFLAGEEVSLIALVDGKRLLPFATARDYKRLLDGDRGPNTGGMGAHSPSGVLDGRSAGEALEHILHPTVEAMADEGRPFVGVLYAGLMLTADGPKVLEFNVRMGDPEAQTLLLRLEDDLLPILAAGADGSFGASRLHFRKEASAVVVLASRGYPERPARGEAIEGLAAAEAHAGVVVFHAGTQTVDGQIVATGGRVLDVGATGPDLATALVRAYGAAAEIRWPAKILRTDIGRRLVERVEPSSETGGFDMRKIVIDKRP